MWHSLEQISFQMWMQIWNCFNFFFLFAMWRAVIFLWETRTSCCWRKLPHKLVFIFFVLSHPSISFLKHLYYIRLCLHVCHVRSMTDCYHWFSISVVMVCLLVSWLFGRYQVISYLDWFKRINGYFPGNFLLPHPWRPEIVAFQYLLLSLWWLDEFSHLTV